MKLLSTPAARDWKSGASNSRPLNEAVVNLLPTPKAFDGPHGGPNQRDTAGNYYLPGQAVRIDDRWVASDGADYGPAISRWEHVTGRSAPCPTEPGAKGNLRLAPEFTEWMMGLPAGWVTGVPDIPRREQLRILGNGVVPQQAYEGYRRLFQMDTREDDMSDDAVTETKPDKPRGDCTGCRFSYILGQGKGEFKGSLVTRKHLSRTGPGECSGSRRPPKGEEVLCQDGPECSQEQGHTGACDGVDSTLDTDDPNQLGTETEHCALGKCVGCCGCSTECTDTPCGRLKLSGIPVPADTTLSGSFSYPGAALSGTLAFADPAPAPQELPPVSGQPEPDRDGWGRYVLNGQSHTRATSFAKLGSSTFALGEWNERMLIKGLAERPDLIALAHGLDVKRDRKQLNQIADDAQTHAGNKVAANIGTAYHSFTERLDAGLMTLEEVPEQYRLRCGQYVAAMREHGLTTRPEWIERTTAVRADQVSAPVPVAGTLDRVLQLPNGELVIGDLKTGSDLSYGFVEIAVQLAIYAHGVNTFGLFDWNTKSWYAPGLSIGNRPVRTDYAIVMHLPADGNGCTLYRVDLVKGWEYAQVSGLVQSRQKDKSVAGVLVPGSLAAPAQESAHLTKALNMCSVADGPSLTQIYGYAESSGVFTPAELTTLREACAERWQGLT